MQAVNSGNMEEAQRLVDEAAYTRNYVSAAYHVYLDTGVWADTPA